jgi:Ribbon-helix-helix protein, copG family
MPLSIRLGEELEHRLARASKRLRLSKSELIKRSLQAFLDDPEPSKSPCELGGDLFGADTSAGATLSVNYKALLKKKLGEKHHR